MPWLFFHIDTYIESGLLTIFFLHALLIKKSWNAKIRPPHENVQNLKICRKNGGKWAGEILTGWIPRSRHISRWAAYSLEHRRYATYASTSVAADPDPVINFHANPDPGQTNTDPMPCGSDLGLAITLPWLNILSSFYFLKIISYILKGMGHRIKF